MFFIMAFNNPMSHMLIAGIKYSDDCMEGCMKLHIECQEFCVGAINGDCAKMCTKTVIHCTMSCIDFKDEMPHVEV